MSFPKCNLGVFLGALARGLDVADHPMSEDYFNLKSKFYDKTLSGEELLKEIDELVKSGERPLAIEMLQATINGNY